MRENKVNINWVMGIYENTLSNIDISTFLQKRLLHFI